MSLSPPSVSPAPPWCHQHPLCQCHPPHVTVVLSLFSHVIPDFSIFSMLSLFIPHPSPCPCRAWAVVPALSACLLVLFLHVPLHSPVIPYYPIISYISPVFHVIPCYYPHRAWAAAPALSCLSPVPLSLHVPLYPPLLSHVHPCYPIFSHYSIFSHVFPYFPAFSCLPRYPMSLQGLGCISCLVCLSLCPFMLSYIPSIYPTFSHIIPCYPVLSHVFPYYPIFSHVIPCCSRRAWAATPALSACPLSPCPFMFPCYPMLSDIFPLSHIIPCYSMLSHVPAGPGLQLLPCLPVPLSLHVILYPPLLSHIIPHYPILFCIFPYYPLFSHVIPHFPL